MTEVRSDMMHLATDAPFFGLMVGKTGSGKTALVVDFIAKNMLRPTGPTWAKVIILSPTAELQSQYWGGFDPRDVHSNPDIFVDVINQIIDFQYKATDGTRTLPILVVLDDVIGIFRGKKASEFEAVFQRLATGGRHSNISVICIAQYMKDRIFSSTVVRGNMTWCVCGNISDTSQDKFIEIAAESKSGMKKAESLVMTCWKERYRFCAVATDDRFVGKVPRITYVKIHPEDSPKLKIKYRE